MVMETEIEKSERLKAKKKAVPGGKPKLINLVKNWLHQGFTYMDKGEQIFKFMTEAVEIMLVYFVLYYVFKIQREDVTLLFFSFIIVHTFNWVTNNLFWSIIMFSFPSLRNPGAVNTYNYLNSMANRLKSDRSISGLSLYGSMSRKQWHDRSDIDMRLLRCSGILNLIFAGFVMMRERLIAFVYRQPLDIFLADDIAFLSKMRSDERPLFLIKRDPRLEKKYPDNGERKLDMDDFINRDS
jgi:predicted nucleotidyltransferase